MKREIVLPIILFFRKCLLIIGLLLICLGVYLLANGIITNALYVETESKVLTVYDDGNERYIVVTFSVNEEQYDVNYPYWNENLDIGDMVTIYYNPNNPNEINARENGYIFSSIVSLVIGAGLFIFSLLTLISYRKEKRRIDDLIMRGKKYIAKIICVEENEKNISFGVTPKILVVELKVNDKIYTLTSKDIWIKYDMNSCINHEVSVYSTDSVFSNYFIDFTEIK